MMSGKILTNFTSMVLIALSVTTVFAQSGRQRPDQQRPEKGSNQATDSKAESSRLKDDETDEVIRVSSALVNIPVSVIDTSGRQVEGLTAEHFILRIDDEERKIDEFATGESPVKIAFLFDNSSSLVSARNFERRASTRFLKTVLRPEKDSASIYSVATEWRLELPFTKDVSALIASIEQMPKPDGATALLDAMMAAIKALDAEDGRRVMVIVSDGEDTVSDTPFNSLLEKLRSSSVQIFVIRTTAYENFKRSGSREISENIRQLTAERRIQEIVRQTGGDIFSPIDDNELEEAFSMIERELSRQYVLGYYPQTSGGEPVGFRRISVTLRDGSDHKVRTRAGYIGPR